MDGVTQIIPAPTRRSFSAAPRKVSFYVGRRADEALGRVGRSAVPRTAERPQRATQPPQTGNTRPTKQSAALLSTSAPLADAEENGISFLMLARPTDFEPALALAYSSFAALKFGVFTLSYVVALGGGLATIVVWALRQRRGGGKEADTAA